MELNEIEELDKLAALVAKRARRGARKPPRLRVVARDDAPERDLEQAAMRAWRTFDECEQQIAGPVLDTSARAVQIRAIVRVAQTYSWQSAIAHFLDSRGVGSMFDLSDPQLADLHDRMQGYVEAAMTGCSLEDCLPAS